LKISRDSITFKLCQNSAEIVVHEYLEFLNSFHILEILEF